MSKFIDYIEKNNLTWQFTMKGAMPGGDSGYRGSLVITEGKFLSADKQLPPKATAKQVIAIADDTLNFFAAELVTMNDFEPMMEKYKEFFTPDTISYLFIIDLDKPVTLEYEGCTFVCIPLDESSVWNELLDIADLEKSELKRKSTEEKTQILVDAAKSASTNYEKVDIEGFKALQTEDTKTNFGAV